MPLTQPYLMEYGDDWPNTCPRRLYDKAMHSLMQQPGQQVVVLSQVRSVAMMVGCVVFSSVALNLVAES